MPWPQEDLTFHEALMSLLNEATFELKGKEVASFSHVHLWAKNLPNNYVRKPTIKKKAKK